MPWLESKPLVKYREFRKSRPACRAHRPDKSDLRVPLSSWHSTNLAVVVWLTSRLLIHVKSGSLIIVQVIDALDYTGLGNANDEKTAVLINVGER